MGEIIILIGLLYAIAYGPRIVGEAILKHIIRP
jgi:hypothetical protein